MLARGCHCGRVLLAEVGPSVWCQGSAQTWWGDVSQKSHLAVEAAHNFCLPCVTSWASPRSSPIGGMTSRCQLSSNIGVVFFVRVAGSTDSASAVSSLLTLTLVGQPGCTMAASPGCCVWSEAAGSGGPARQVVFGGPKQEAPEVWQGADQPESRKWVSSRDPRKTA